MSSFSIFAGQQCSAAHQGNSTRRGHGETISSKYVRRQNVSKAVKGCRISRLFPRSLVGIRLRFGALFIRISRACCCRCDDFFVLRLYSLAKRPRLRHALLVRGLATMQPVAESRTSLITASPRALVDSLALAIFRVRCISTAARTRMTLSAGCAT